ncbi:MAG: isochorismatase family protein [Verrucomicrobiota bacterium]
MNAEAILEALENVYLPVEKSPYSLKPKTGLVIVDIVKGFAEVGAGPLAPAEENPQINRMVTETNILAKRFIEADLPVLAFLDTHTPGVPEPPYPPHCEIGSGQENFVEPIAWLENESSVVKIRKDCINGYIGAENSESGNEFKNWIQDHGIEHLIIVGICTDICVMDFVLTALSARNHQLLGNIEDIVVFEPACSTYDLPPATAEALNLPRSASHPQMMTHHVGLYFMASRGARIASSIHFEPAD